MDMIRDHDTVVICCPEGEEVAGVALELKKQLEKEFPNVHFVTIGVSTALDVKVVFVYRNR